MGSPVLCGFLSRAVWVFWAVVSTGSYGFLSRGISCVVWIFEVEGVGML